MDLVVNLMMKNYPENEIEAAKLKLAYEIEIATIKMMVEKSGGKHGRNRYL